MTQKNNGECISGMLVQREKVLCVMRSLLPETVLFKEGFLPLSWDTCSEIIMNAQPMFVERDRAEHDPSLKQIIPYAMVITKSMTCATYCRAGNETRLRGKWSVGIGGHVGDDDHDHGCSIPQAILQGLRRELAEEISGINNAPLKFIGLINEERSQVGIVHLGLVFMVSLAETDACNPGKELKNFTWKPFQELFDTRNQNQFELWSQLAVQLAKHCFMGEEAVRGEK